MLDPILRLPFWHINNDLDSPIVKLISQHFQIYMLVISQENAQFWGNTKGQSPTMSCHFMIDNHSPENSVLTNSA